MASRARLPNRLRRGLVRSGIVRRSMLDEYLQHADSLRSGHPVGERRRDVLQLLLAPMVRFQLGLQHLQRVVRDGMNPDSLGASACHPTGSLACGANTNSMLATA